jgi:hypothetical protein
MHYSPVVNDLRGRLQCGVISGIDFEDGHMTMPRILALAGSTRSDSYNKKLVRLAADAARVAGADVTVLDL